MYPFMGMQRDKFQQGKSHRKQEQAQVRKEALNHPNLFTSC
jgi:hypothetical protein